MTLAEWLETWRRRIDEALPALLPARHETAGSVHDAMAYALLSPGKRVRPTLIQAVGEMYRARPDRLMAPAGAIEMVHTASLVLDDLPCMDDAATRRGRPSCHTAYGEATAILAAIGLLNHAFAVLAGESASPQLKDSLRADVARRLALAIGPDGVIGGQAADLASAGRTAGPAPPGDLATLEFIHSHKTGSLFIASAEIGAQICGATDGEMEALRAYAMNLGLAFQITDDLIDAVGDEESAGKPVRADAGRPTFVTMCGVEGARTLAAELIETAVASLAPFGRRSARLSGLARFIARRDR
ncbi:MAG TPA: polyprenyl synthetase family protein [Candidatus Polarisedimenticolia bacterium]|nr:polyprenyl synthetase family protein [Candidatus Polarisedimenticolia bacterium]